MREGKEEKPLTLPTPTAEVSREFPYPMGLRLPAILVLGDLRTRLRTEDVVNLEGTIERDVDTIISQTGPLHYKHAAQTLLAGESQPLWGNERVLKKLLQPFVMDCPKARLLPHSSTETREAIVKIGKEIQGLLNENLKDRNITSQYDEHYMRTRDYYRSLMLHVKQSSASDEKDLREAIFLARACADPADFKNVLADIERAKPGEYSTVVDDIYTRCPHLEPHREALQTLFTYLNKGALNPPALQKVVAAFESLPQEPQQVIAREFTAWLRSQETFFAFHDGCIHEHQVTSIKELEQVERATARLRLQPDSSLSLDRYMLMSVLRHDTSPGFAQTAAALNELNESPWYRQYNAWLERIRTKPINLYDISEQTESGGSVSASEQIPTSNESEFAEYGGAHSLATQVLRLSLHKVWLRHIREIWRERNEQRLPNEREIRESPLFVLLAQGDAVREKLWVGVLTGRNRG